MEEGRRRLGKEKDRNQGLKCVCILCVCIVCVCVLCVCSLSREVLSAPNVLRVGSKENVFVEIQDHSGGPFMVTVTVMDHPKKSKKLFEKAVQLNSDNKFQSLVEVFVSCQGNNVLFTFSANYLVCRMLHKHTRKCRGYTHSNTL